MMDADASLTAVAHCRAVYTREIIGIWDFGELIETASELI